MGNKWVVELLLEKGADINQACSNSYDLNALILALLHDFKETVELLIERGANINHTCSGGETALVVASGSGNKEIVELLLDMGAAIKPNGIFSFVL